MTHLQLGVDKLHVSDSFHPQLKQWARWRQVQQKCCRATPSDVRSAASAIGSEPSCRQRVVNTPCWTSLDKLCVAANRRDIFKHGLRYSADAVAEVYNVQSQPSHRAASSKPTDAAQGSGSPAACAFCVINFYHLADVDQPNKAAAAHKARLEGTDLRGRIYISAQGINAQYGGPETQAVEYAQWVKSQQPFLDLRWTVAPVEGHMFPRLRVTHRPSLVSLSGGTHELPITDASQRATPLSPSAWKDMLRTARPFTPTASRSSSRGHIRTRNGRGSWRSLGDIPRQQPQPPAVSASEPAARIEAAAAACSSSDAADTLASDRQSDGSRGSAAHSPSHAADSSSSSSSSSSHSSRNEADCRGWPSILSSRIRSNGSSCQEENTHTGSVSSVNSSGGDDPSRKQAVVLDVRNGYEWDAGHFKGAARPREATFSETPTDVEGVEAQLPEELRDCPGDTPVMMYCTGGIRCDIYSTYLRQRGFTNLYSLEGGVHAYLKEEGSDSWNGSLFVFDDRLAVSADQSLQASGDGTRGAGAESLPAAVDCQLCGGTVATLPHLNCANIDCSRLFVACAACKTRLAGCCCEACQTDGRLVRPQTGGVGSVFPKVSHLFPPDQLARLAEGRGEGRLRRRRKYEARLREKNQRLREQRAQQRAVVKAAMAARGLAPDAQTRASGRHRPSTEGTPEAYTP